MQQVHTCFAGSQLHYVLAVSGDALQLWRCSFGPLPSHYNYTFFSLQLVAERPQGGTINANDTRSADQDGDGP